MPSLRCIPSLDGIRAVSIIIVFIAHCGFTGFIPGGFGVTIFFFLSGFLITTLLCREWDSDGRISLRAFYIRRLLRLGPPLAAVLVVSLLLFRLEIVDGSLHIPTLVSQIFFYYNYFSIYSENATTTVDGLALLWSLSVEEHFYFLWPLFFILVATARLSIRSVLVLLSLVLLWRCVKFLLYSDSEWNIYIATDTRLDSILYGGLLAIMNWKNLSKFVFPPITRAWWLIAAALLLLMFTFLFRDEVFRSTIRYSLQGIALIPLFYYAVNCPKALIFQPLNWSVMRALGHLSYSVYLVHHVVIRGLEFNGIAEQGTLLMIAIAGGASILIAFAIYRYIEKPLYSLRHKMRPVMG